MKSLFAKILLWFGATIAVTFVGFFVITAMTIEQAEPQRSPRERFFQFQLQRARFAYETGGKEELARVLTRRPRRGERPFREPRPGGPPPGDRPRAQVHLTDAQGRDLLSGEDLSHLKNSDPAPWRFLFGGRRPPFTRVVTDGEYRYIMRAAEAEQPFWFFAPQHLWVLGVSILFCSALAFYLTAPLRKLRKTVERFGQGDLSARTNTRRRDELGELGRTFDRMAERIEVLRSAERRLLQDVSHELRSPLARLGVAAALVESEDDRAGALKQIRRESERLNTLIGELLQVTRAEGDAETLRVVPVQLSELLREVAADCSVEATARNCQLRFDPSAAATVQGDPELLRRAVENLVRNAIRHTAEDTTVEIRLGRQDDQAVVSVRDHGPGVPEEVLSRIFDPFYRVEGDRNRQGGGAGLGLSIARRAVALHKGTISAVNSNPGLAVEIQLPLSRNDVPESEQLDAEVATAAESR